jgi:hypothetical protein
LTDIASCSSKGSSIKLRKLFSLVAFLVLILSACSAATPGAEPQFAPTILPDGTTAPQEGVPQSEAEVPRVTLEDAVAALQSGEAIVVDVRSPEAYQASHIPGALSVPLGEIETNPDGLPLDKDQWIITYCT